MSYGCKREEEIYIYIVSGCTFAASKFFYIFILHADESVQIYITMLLWVVETVSLKVMACDCLLHYFLWDSVVAILRDSIPLKVIVWDCPHCYRALNWIEFILVGMGQPQKSSLLKDVELIKFSGQQLESLTVCLESIWNIF